MINMLNKLTSPFFIILSIIIVAVACATNPLTGRKQFALVDQQTVNTLALQEYQSIKTKSKVLSPATNSQAAMVTRVGSKLADAITRYYTSQGLGQYLNGLQWEYMLIEENMVNAWCMPGGKIAVYTGILPVTQNENALAVVLGHEVAHAIAEHGKERMSQTLAQQYGGMALSILISQKPAETQALFNTAFGLGSQYGVILPFSRSNELEADKLGLTYCALAGYDPREAVPFWKRMSAKGGGNNPPEFLSTHPAEQTRIEQIEKLLPDAVKLYEKTKVSGAAPR